MWNETDVEEGHVKLRDIEWTAEMEMVKMNGGSDDIRSDKQTSREMKE